LTPNDGSRSTDEQLRHEVEEERQFATQRQSVLNAFKKQS